MVACYSDQAAGGCQTAASRYSLLPQLDSKTSIKLPTTNVFEPEIQAFEELPTNLKESFDAQQHQVKALG